MASTAIHDREARIGILGGGAAGLSTAYYLQQQGYTNLTLFERESRVGGKALTVDIEDKKGITKTYELGAEYITYTYDHIWELIDVLGVETEEAASIVVINRKGETPRFVQPTEIAPLSEVLPAALKYLWLGYMNLRQIVNPSNVGVAANKLLTMSTSQFIEKYDLSSLGGFFLVEQFGYGTFETFPVVNLYRTVQPRLMLRIFGGQIPVIKDMFERPVAAMAVGGLQGMYEDLARYVDEHSDEPVVHVDKAVTRIDPIESGGVTLTVNDEEEHSFDALVVAVPPPMLLSLIPEQEQSALQKELFPKFVYNPYYVGTFETLETREPLIKAYYNNIWLDKTDGVDEPEPVQFTKRWDETDILARGYNWTQASNFPEGHTEHLEEVFERFMAERMETQEYRLLTGEDNKYWPTYYPHVPIEELQAGFYDRFEELQGERNIFYVGSAMSMESMEETVAYCKQLVDTRFGDK